VATTSRNSFSTLNNSAQLESEIDISLLLIVFLLFGIGLVQVYSSSFILATETKGDGLFFIRKQAIFTIGALIALFGISRVPFRWIQYLGWTMWGTAFFGIILTLIPSIGHRAGGAARWINFGFFRFEPSELMKVSLPLILSHVLTNTYHKEKRWDYAIKAALLLTPLPLLLKQPDFGTVAIYSMVLFGMLFVAGLNWRWIAGMILTMVPTFYFLVMNVPYRRARLESFLNPWSDPTKSGFQVIQSLLSFSSGGLTGVGLGQGQGKLFFLPEAHTDFTLAVWGEETGFIGFGLLLLLYGLVVFRGFRIGVRSESSYSRLMALGLIFYFALQVMTNIGVVIGLLPPKGLTLPFLSYGGSSLVVMGILFGILLNIERHNKSAS
jgi:cell division protein FtsW